MRRRLSNESGMTLIEVMLAVGVMAITLSLLFGSMVNMKTMGQVTRDGTRAAIIISNTLEQMRTTSVATFMATNLTVSDGPGTRRTLTVKAANAAGTWVTLPSNTALSTMPNPIEVQATLVWEDERGRVYSRSASTKVPR